MIDYQTSMFDASIMTSPISITTLAALASAGVLRSVQLVGQVGGYRGSAGIRAKNSQKLDNLLLVKNFFTDSCRPSIPAACTPE
ncbi:hypothetical protein, partial [Xanthomonas euvesicatoria]|uniref:hypothetical protein n=1 Tax=Xanthomonas euvesicatoria TaxID=456327 RepID=UPI0004A303E4